MPDILISCAAGAVAGAAACLVLARIGLPLNWRSAEGRSAKAEPAAPPALEAAPDTSPPAVAPAEPESRLPALIRALSPLAEDVGDPRELRDMAEFQAVVAAFRRPDMTFALLRQYALSDNWSASCAALTVLMDHAERRALCDPLLRKLGTMQPYSFLYAFAFLTSLEQRPPLGAVVLSAREWWRHDPVIPDLLREYFERSAKLGDTPDFGNRLDEKADIAVPPLKDLLQKIQHPFAEQLLAALSSWEEKRIDRKFLATVGALWNPAESDPLLISPPAWQDSLALAESAIRQSRPRSLLVSGDPRVGKSAFLRLLGETLQRAGWTIFSASSAELMANQMYFGQLEGRIRQLIEALHVRRKLVWYVRDLAQIANSGSHKGQSASILDQILPAMAAGNLIIVGETNQAAATRLLQSRPSLRSLMEVVPLQPMREDETLALATEVAERIARHAGVVVSQQAIGATMDLAQHYLGDKQLPGVVLELLKRAANRAISAEETELTDRSVIEALSQMSGLPPLILDTGQRVELARVRAFFSSRVIGQDEAIGAIVDRIAMLKAGLIDPGRPIGVFLFAGPTGTGKRSWRKRSHNSCSDRPSA